MAYDPSVLQDIGSNLVPDFAGATSKAFQLKDLMTKNDLDQLKLKEARQADADQETVRKLAKGADLSTQKGVADFSQKLTKEGLYSQAMTAMKTGQDIASGELDNQIKTLQVQSAQQDSIVGMIDPVVAHADALRQAGKSDAIVNAYIQSQVPVVLDQVQKSTILSPETKKFIIQKLQSGQVSYDQLRSFEAQSKQGQAQLKSRLDALNVDSEIKRRNQEHDEAEQRLQIAKQNAASFGPEDGDLLGALAERNVSLPSGLRSKQQIKATLDGLRNRNPGMTADQIADGIKSGKLQLTAETSGARVAGTQIGKVALAANELDTFGDQVLDALKGTDLNKVPVGMTLRGVLQMGEKEASNSGLLNLRLKLQALNNAYDQLSARGGTDKDKREHIHSLFDARLSDEGIRTLVTAVKQEAVGARAAADRTIGQVSSASIPGAGPPPPAGGDTGGWSIKPVQ